MYMNKKRAGSSYNVFVPNSYSIPHMLIFLLYVRLILYTFAFLAHFI